MKKLKETTITFKTVWGSDFQEKVCEKMFFLMLRQFQLGVESFHKDNKVIMEFEGDISPFTVIEK